MATFGALAKRRKKLFKTKFTVGRNFSFLTKILSLAETIFAHEKNVGRKVFLPTNIFSAHDFNLRWYFCRRNVKNMGKGKDDSVSAAQRVHAKKTSAEALSTFFIRTVHDFLLSKDENSCSEKC